MFGAKAVVMGVTSYTWKNGSLTTSGAQRAVGICASTRDQSKLSLQDISEVNHDWGRNVRVENIVYWTSCPRESTEGAICFTGLPFMTESLVLKKKKTVNLTDDVKPRK